MPKLAELCCQVLCDKLVVFVEAMAVNSVSLGDVKRGGVAVNNQARNGLVVLSYRRGGGPGTAVNRVGAVLDDVGLVKVNLLTTGEALGCGPVASYNGQVWIRNGRHKHYPLPPCRSYQKNVVHRDSSRRVR